MPPSRIPALALAADLVAVIVFAAVGRVSHAEADDVFGLVATAAPFVAGALVARATPAVRVNPAGLRAGVTVLASTVVLGLALRFAFTGRLPLSFAVVAVIALTVLLLGWRALSVRVSHRAEQRVP